MSTAGSDSVTVPGGNSNADREADKSGSQTRPTHQRQQSWKSSSSTSPRSSIGGNTGSSSIPQPSRPSGGSGSQNSGVTASPNGGTSKVFVKVGLIGDSQIGKTSLMVKYVEGTFDEDYIQTLGVNFMEKSITLRNSEITFSIWDLGGQKEFVNMLPIVCNDAVAILFMFDLSRVSTLHSIKDWYRQVRGLNKTAIPLLIGTKFDYFITLPIEDQREITKLARKYAKAMKGPLIFTSSSHSINVQKIFKIILSRVFDLKCTFPQISNVGEPILEW